MADLIFRAEAIEKAKHDYDFLKGSSKVVDKVRRDELLNVIFWLGNLPSANTSRAYDTEAEAAEEWNKMAES